MIRGSRRSGTRLCSRPALRVRFLSMDSDAKRSVREFWNTSSCGEVYAEGESMREQMLAQAEARYRLEPYLKPFARFDGSGKRVLEIGVGMGADHVEWAKSEPTYLAGIDLTPRAVEWTQHRLRLLNLSSDVALGDAENLGFEDDSFDVVYSWGVIHHSPNTSSAVDEILRVLRPGGVARIMVYHRPSVVGLLLWARYGFLGGKPRTTLSTIYAKYLESPGTKGYTVSEARSLFSGYHHLDIRPHISFGDLLDGKVGQGHSKTALEIARRCWPRPLVRHLHRFGLLLLIEATK